MSQNSCHANKRNGHQNNIFKIKNLDSKIQNLIREATEARMYSYSPYSKFKVGACVMTENGTLHRGCNIENKSFPVTLCAEKSAYSNAITEGYTKFKAVAVVAHQDQYFTTPCGACRQFMSEFGNVDVYISKPDEEDILVLSLEDLLPYQFKTIGNDFS